jgi:predicted DNA-binding transcriptional regulator YafY
MSNRLVLSRIRRIVKLLGLLQGGQEYNANALADACGVSRRTIFRDLDALRAAEVPLVYDEKRQSYRIPGHYFLPPTNFTADEAMALIVLSHQLGQRGLPFYAAARSAAAKLENSLPDRLLQYLRKVTGAVRIKLDATNPLQGKEEVYQQLLAAAAERRCVRIQYASLYESKTLQTKLHPYKLLFNQHSWYVIGRSTVHREVRTFNIGRIRQLEPLDDGFEIPPRFNLDRYLRNAWRLIPEDGPDHEVVIRFSPRVARNVAEVVWHKTQRHCWLDDGRLELRVTVSGLQEISWWILGYGDHAEVVEPRALRQLIAERAESMVALYAADRRAAKHHPVASTKVNGRPAARARNSGGRS